MDEKFMTMIENLRKVYKKSYFYFGQVMKLKDLINKVACHYGTISER